MAHIRAMVREFTTIAQPIFEPFWRPLRVVFALLALSIVLTSVYPLLYGRLTDALVNRNGHMAVVMIVILLTQSLAVLAIEYWRDYYEDEHITWDLNLHIMTSSLERISGLSMAQFASAHTGKTRDVVRNGRSALRELVKMAIYRLGTTILKLLLALVGIAFVSPLVGSVAMTCTVVYLMYAVYLFKRHRAPIRELEDQDNNQGKLFADTLSNMEVVKAYAREGRTVSDFHADGRLLVRNNVAFWRTARPLYYYRNGIAIAGRNTIMALTAYLLFRDVFTFGVFMSLTQWAMQAVGATQELGQMQREVSLHWAKLELYIDLLRQPPDIVVAANATCPTQLRGAIEFSDVVYEYKPRSSDDPLEHLEPTIALNGVSFSIPSGQKVALVGESGAGKSTIAYALIRAGDPKSGVIRIGDADIRELDLTSLRRRIGYVPQQPKLFDRTLRYNLTFGLEHPEAVPDEFLREALALVKLEKFTDNGHLDSRLGEGGHSLSGGERQRLCIARALIKNPDVLIFDEATSSLDPVNEKKVQDAIDAARGRTKLIIAHRYSTIRDVDRILVFDSGRLVDDGTHEELISDSPYYHTLLEQQGLL
jgi:ATP-binding cassette subfamily B protein